MQSRKDILMKESLLAWLPNVLIDLVCQYGKSQNVAVFGGFTGSSSERFDPTTDRWSKLPDLPQPGYGYRAAFWEGKVFLLGSSVYPSIVLDLASFEWTNMARMNVARYAPGVWLYGHKIYVYGGQNESNVLNCGEAYDCKTGKWSMLSSRLKVAKYLCGSCVMDHKLWLIGGGSGISISNSAEYYDTSTDMWVSVAPMKVRRQVPAVSTHSDRVYVFGGYDRGAFLASCECYDTREETWVSLPSLPSPRAYATASLLDDFIYVCGGAYYNMSLSSCCVFDPKTRCWTSVSPMTTSRELHAACVIEME